MRLVQGGAVKMWRGAEYVDDMVAKTEVRVVVDDEFLGRMIDGNHSLDVACRMIVDEIAA